MSNPVVDMGKGDQKFKRVYLNTTSIILLLHWNRL